MQYRVFPWLGKSSLGLQRSHYHLKFFFSCLEHLTCYHETKYKGRLMEELRTKLFRFENYYWKVKPPAMILSYFSSPQKVHLINLSHWCIFIDTMIKFVSILIWIQNLYSKTKPLYHAIQGLNFILWKGFWIN